MQRLRWTSIAPCLLLCLPACLTAKAQTAPAAAVPPVYPSVYPDGNATALGAQIQALLANPSVARAHWGIAVTAMDGTPIYGLDEGKLFRPASVAKLFTTAAAMEVLGPDATVITSVFGDLQPSGIVKGDLELDGEGDANLGTNNLPYHTPAKGDGAHASASALTGLERLADQLVAKGVKEVTGNIYGRDADFRGPVYPDGWALEDIPWGYGAPVSALTIADNQLRLTITPGKFKEYPRNAAIVDLEQNDVLFYTVTVDVTTEKKGAPGGIQVERDRPQHLHVYGSIAADAPPDVEHVAIDDPALYAAMAFRAILIRHGIKVGGIARTSHGPQTDGRSFLEVLRAPGGNEKLILPHSRNDATGTRSFVSIECTDLSRLHNEVHSDSVLAAITSAPLAEDIVFTAKTSQNLHAELLLPRLGALPSGCGGGGSTVEGARVVRQYLLNAGLDSDDFIFYDGSGLSAKDLVTPRATAQLLAYVAKQPWFTQWKPALPVGGVDGTLASRFKDAPLKGHVYAKTGTLGESRAIAGYVDAASGQTIIFSIMVDNHTPASSADRAVMDKIVAAIAAAN